MIINIMKKLRECYVSIHTRLDKIRFKKKNLSQKKLIFKYKGALKQPLRSYLKNKKSHFYNFSTHTDIYVFSK